jgi:hypothetical protein
MTAFRIFAIALALSAWSVSMGQESKTTSDPRKGPKVKRALNKAFHGRVVKIKKKQVTLYYDFEDPIQLEDFEEARPPRLLDASQNRVRIQGGRLVLEGSTAIRHKMEGSGEFRARVYVRVGQQRNVGTVFTEPILSDFYVVLNLFDERFYGNGNMLLAACGLHEDEGADVDMSLVNWRDIFGSNLKKKVKVGQDAEIEVYKDGWKEYARVDDVEGRGSSKGKCKQMEAYQFGLWVHESRATFDDLTIELTDEFLHLNDLKAEVAVEWEEVPEDGPLKGIKGVPPRIRTQIEQYAYGKGDAKEVYVAVARAGLPKKAREAAAQVLEDRRDPRAVPIVIDGLYSEDRLTRKLSIGVIRSIVGTDFGYSPGAKEKTRSKAIRKLNEHIQEYRSRYFG